MSDQPSGASQSTLYLSKIIIAALLVLLCFKVADRIVKGSGKLPVAPEPNAYETLLTIARDVKVPSGELIDLSSETIRQTADLNRKHVERLHEALRQEIAVPLNTKQHWVKQHDADVKMLKKLAVVLGMQSRVEMEAGRTNLATAYLLDVIILGQSMSRGGVLSDGIHAMVVETLGAATLRMQLPQINAEACRKAAQELERFEQKREAAERIIATEKEWAIASFGITGRVIDQFQSKAQAHRRAEFTNRYNKVTHRTRRLILSLALRAVELESGTKVRDLKQLVPGVLAAIPLDPETNKAFSIQSTEGAATAD